MISATVDRSLFNKRTAELERGIVIDWQHFVRDTAMHATSDLSAKSAIGKIKKTSQDKAIARDVNRAAKGLGATGWTNPQIKKLIAKKDWSGLESKLSHVRSSDKRIQRIQSYGLRRFDQGMHKRARMANGRVSRSYQGPMVIPNDQNKKRYKKEKLNNRGILRAGWWPAANHLRAKRGFPSFVTKHGERFGGFYDGTKMDSPMFSMRNSAPGAGNDWFAKSFDWWMNSRAQKSKRAVAKMVQNTAQKFNSGQSIRGNYTGQEA
jgi:hypothetical protein